MDVKNLKKKPEKLTFRHSSFQKGGASNRSKNLFCIKNLRKNLKRFMMLFFKNRPPELLLTMRYGPFEVVINQKGPAVSKAGLFILYSGSALIEPKAQKHHKHGG
ncbi:hypothetical protein GN241_14125 [Rhodobacteraceae bacterium IMCC1335]